ncbi:hypothetical protein PO124_22050 [Bacillus licheniformis]|nr:hypothetical protein [Bacillus licheniformis]
MGAETMLYSQAGTQPFIARVDSRTDVQAGDTIPLALDMNKAHFLIKKRSSASALKDNTVSNMTEACCGSLCSYASVVSISTVSS